MHGPGARRRHTDPFFVLLTCVHISATMIPVYKGCEDVSAGCDVIYFNNTLVFSIDGKGFYFSSVFYKVMVSLRIMVNVLW